MYVTSLPDKVHLPNVPASSGCRPSSCTFMNCLLGSQRGAIDLVNYPSPAVKFSSLNGTTALSVTVHHAQLCGVRQGVGFRVSSCLPVLSQRSSGLSQRCAVCCILLA